MARRLGQNIRFGNIEYFRNDKPCGVLTGSRSQYLRKEARGGQKPRTVYRIWANHGSSMREVHEGYPIWYKPTERLLWRKSPIILMLVGEEMCHDEQCIEPC